MQAKSDSDKHFWSVADEQDHSEVGLAGKPAHTDTGCQQREKQEAARPYLWFRLNTRSGRSDPRTSSIAMLMPQKWVRQDDKQDDNGPFVTHTWY